MAKIVDVKESAVSSKRMLTLPKDIADILGGVEKGDGIAWIVVEDKGKKYVLVEKRENPFTALKGKHTGLNIDIHNIKW